jgi:glycosyltransferase involved in cell wall biosynthesis
MHPAPGGAEAYLNHTIAHLGARGDVVIDVATCDVGTIHDQWQFSARYGAAPAGQQAPSGARRVHRFALDAPAAESFDKCRTLHSMWMRESCDQWIDLFHDIEEPMLLGGWNYAERSGDSVWRWSSLCSQVGLPGGFDAIRIEGSSNEPRHVALEAAGRRAEQDVSAAFALELDVGEAARAIACLRVDAPLVTTDDPRELGVIVTRISLRRGGEWVDLDLRGDAEQWLRKREPQAWVDSLIRTTQLRDLATDKLFIEVRGPHSAEMASWIERHVLDYDALIVQGTPFAPIAWVPPIARRFGVPVMLLPHFHVEDRYYHWRSYYDAFRDADLVLAAPDSAKRRFFDPIDAHSEVVPGGGLDLEEFVPAHLAECRAQFERVHTSAKPFVLVLGRKALGKHYSLALDAARLPDAQFEVVMVGPDEDARPIAQEGVHYYGARPREFVIGALAACACLVNMSDSESFGIVLLEAWAAGRPVIAQRRCVAFEELVREGENGYLAETPGEILERANRYVADAALAAQHGSAGRELASRYSWECVADRIRELALRVAMGVNAARRPMDPRTPSARAREVQSTETAP